MRHYVHHVPGRLRVRVADVKGNAARARSLESLLRVHQGVASVEANPLTGSVLIHYDPAVVTGEALATIVTGDQLNAPLARIPEGPLAGGMMQDVTRAAARRLAELVIEKAAVALIAAVL